jgi:uncharacterized protein (TIGR00730 family)
MNICVYCSSSDAVDPEYFRAADELGELLGSGGHTLIYGGTDIGLMGRLARATHEHKGKVIGIIPDAIYGRGLGYRFADELIVTATMHERKLQMEDRADAFLALPGGFGTLEEVSQVITLKQLGYFNKAIAFINTKGYYNALAEFFETGFREHFCKETSRALYHMADTPAAAMDYVSSYKPIALPEKWFSAAEAKP